jgi:hypothetical protein
MITFPASPSRTGVAPACLLDIQTMDGDIYYIADRAISFVPAVITPDGNPLLAQYLPWLMTAPTFRFYRSTQTDTGTIQLQNISGDTVTRDFSRLARHSALEGAIFVFRWWQAGGEFAWREVHGMLSVVSISGTSAQLTATQTLAGNDDTPAEFYSENCQLVWKEKRCGATGSTECMYSYQTCQVPERYMGVLNTYEKAYDESVAPIITQTVNRRRGL